VKVCRRNAEPVGGVDPEFDNTVTGPRKSIIDGVRAARRPMARA